MLAPPLNATDALTGDPPEHYLPRWAVADDPEWEHYLGFMAPDDYALQTIWNRRLIRIFQLINACLRTQDDYRLIAYAYGHECARHNIRYAEVTFSIETNLRKSGLPWMAILEGLNAGRENARLETGVELRWIFDIVRDHPSTQDQVLEIALAARAHGCVALGLGGSEQRFPPRLFKGSFERARQVGLPRVPISRSRARALPARRRPA